MATRILPLDYDIVVYSGTSYKREFRWLPDGVIPIDFTGWSAMMLIGQPFTIADIELTNGDGIQLTSIGQIIIELTPAQTGALLTSVTRYSLDLKEPDGFVRRFLRGRLSVVMDAKPIP